MSSRLRATIALIATAALLGACGSATKTVSAGGAPPASTQATAPSTSGKTASTQTGSTPVSQSTSGETGPPSKTRTAPAPAFAEKEGATASEGLSAAMAVVRAKGFTPSNTSDYHANQTLRVLIGTRTGSGDGYGQQAFFFVDGRYIGTDASQPSATLRVVSQSDTEVTLAYPLYRKSDPLCCPSGGQATVHFQLNDGMLTPLGKIPPASSASGLSRQ